MTAVQAVARTAYGQLQGFEDGGVLSFRGIPFAKAPVGPLRFGAPQPPEPWQGVRDATRYGPAAPQAESYATQLLGIILDQEGEDCLSLNVWTPALDGGRRPVMVWIHGGAFVIGAGAQALYNGAALARRGDAVVVTINYRLGMLGFLRGREATGGALDSTGNEAMHDQVAALAWVRDNIAAFGGDPENVTVFGESAGSISVAALLTMPAAKGLFHKAILESGALNLLTTPAAANDICRKVLDDLGIAPADAARLRDLPLDQVMATQNRATPRAGGVSYAPVADGEIIPTDPLAVLAAGSAAGIPILIGTNRDEAKLFRFMDPASASIDEAALLARVTAIAGANAERLIGAYRAARAARGEEVSPGELWFAISSDAMFRVAAMRLAAVQTAHAPAYAYLFTWETPAMNGMLGAAHALELPFVFGALDDPGLGKLILDKAGAAILSEKMQDAWLAFARTGNPNTPALPGWPAYDTTRRATMLFGASVELADAPLEPERAAWG